MPVSSNVRPRMQKSVPCLNSARPSGLASTAPPIRAASDTLKSSLFVTISSPTEELAVTCAPKFSLISRNRFTEFVSVHPGMSSAFRAHGARRIAALEHCWGAPQALHPAGRPNHSLNRTRYGRRRKPGVRRLRHLRTPGLRPMPLS